MTEQDEPMKHPIEDSTMSTMEGHDVPADADYVDLPRYEYLDAQSALPITGAAPVRLIAVVGPNDSGKTTLVATIYELFLRNRSFAGLLFAGSETLLGFEQRSHLARDASGLALPDTERTTRTTDFPLLHLRVRAIDLMSQSRDLLFTDVAGEVFRDAKDSTDFMIGLEFLRRADWAVILVNGQSIITLEDRFAATNSARDFLRRALDSQMFGRQTRVDILTTKWDVVETLPNEDRKAVDSFVGSFSTAVTEDFGDRVKALRFANVAARPAPGSNLAEGFGLDSLLPAWVRDGQFTHAEPRHVNVPQLSREADKYLLRRPNARNVG